MGDRTRRQDDAPADRPADTADVPLRERLEEPIRRVSELTDRTLAWFPVRVWRHFLARNGFLLAAGMSYQAIFAVLAGIYVAFAIAGIWLFGNELAYNAFVEIVNSYAPGVIGDNGIVDESQLENLANSGVSLFGWTGAAALAGVIWTAIGYITYSRTAVRSAFDLAKDDRNYFLLKTRDLLAGLAFGASLLVAALLSVATTSLLKWLFGLIGIDDGTWLTVLVRAGGLVIVFAIDTIALAVLYRFLSGAAVPWHRLWTGSLIGGLALALLQLAANLLLTLATRSPLYATFAAFAVFLGLLLWFRFTNIVILVAASWIAVEARDRGETLRRVTPEQLEAEQHAAEQRALVLAARVRVREAQAELDSAGWMRRPAAKRRLKAAEEELAEAEAG
ncbi:YihY/virulence factor BrkB family protein [Agromyces archimandritae]|uniref:YihY/virulence factor BrkB family protein n=1 Tax=Agromyces archimandritae TaxID=2781962 RepID=UPI001FD46BB8|nr:YihY/virulence factor BrkB family protein [Agromyces archimandritae]